MKQLGVTSAVVWGRFGTDPNHDKGEPDHGWVLWFPIRTSFICLFLNWNEFYLFVPKPEPRKCVRTTHALSG
jgi:hypothetical protein